MPTYEASRSSTASSEAAWRVWTDVPGWKGNDLVESAEIDGEFKAGAVIRSKAKGLPRSILKVTRVEPPHLWADEARSPGARMTFDHTIEPQGAGIRLTERVVITGPLAPLIGPLIRRRLEVLFASSISYVARIAERGESPSP